MAELALNLDTSPARQAYEQFLRDIGSRPATAPLTTGGNIGGTGVSSPTTGGTSGGISGWSSASGPHGLGAPAIFGPIVTGGTGGAGGVAGSAGGPQQAAAAVQHVVAAFNAQAAAAVQQAAQQYTQAMGGGFGGTGMPGRAFDPNGWKSLNPGGWAAVNATGGAGGIAPPGSGFGPMNADLGGAGDSPPGGAGPRSGRLGSALAARFAGPYAAIAAVHEAGSAYRNDRRLQVEQGNANSYGEYLRGQASRTESMAGGFFGGMMGSALDVSDAIGLTNGSGPTNLSEGFRRLGAIRDTSDRVYTQSVRNQLSSGGREAYESAYRSGGAYAASREAAQQSITSRFTEERAGRSRQIAGLVDVNAAAYAKGPLQGLELSQYQSRQAEVGQLQTAQGNSVADEQAERVRDTRAEDLRIRLANASTGDAASASLRSGGVFRNSNRFDRGIDLAQARHDTMVDAMRRQEKRDARLGNGSPLEQLARYGLNTARAFESEGELGAMRRDRADVIASANVNNRASARSTVMRARGDAYGAQMEDIGAAMENVDRDVDPGERESRRAELVARGQAAGINRNQEHNAFGTSFLREQRSRFGAAGVMGRQLARDPLGAQLAGYQNQLAVESANIADAAPNTQMVTRSMRGVAAAIGATGQGSLAFQQYQDRVALDHTQSAFQNESLRISARGTGTPLQRQQQAETNSIVGSTYSQALAAVQAGRGDRVGDVFKTGRLEIEAQQRSYLDSFHAQEANLSRTATTSDPAAAMAGMAAAIKKLEKVPSADELRTMIRDAVKDLDAAR